MLHDDDPEDDPKVAEPELEETLVRSIDEGRRRLPRKPWPLVATGIIGGIDVGTGVLALLVVEDATESVLLAGLAFTIGFVALTLAKSELFTEDLLVPVMTVFARQARFRCFCACGRSPWWPTSWAGRGPLSSTRSRGAGRLPEPGHLSSRRRAARPPAAAIFPEDRTVRPSDDRTGKISGWAA